MIKAVFFDFGGVLTQGKFTHALATLLHATHRVSIAKAQAVIGDLLRELNRNSITFEQFHETLNKRLDIHTSVHEIGVLFANAIRPDEYVLHIVDEVRKNYKVFIATNNNAPTLDALRKEHTLLLERFERIYSSHEMDLAKPDPLFYRTILNDLKLTAQECIFIDDQEQNVQTASAVGMHAIRYESPLQLQEDLMHLGALVARRSRRAL